jgi:hypothetical protein
MMKALLVAVALCFLLFSGFLRGEESGAPASRVEEIAQLRRRIETLEERVEQLEKRLDRRARPRMVPLICIGVSKDLP